MLSKTFYWFNSEDAPWTPTDVAIPTMFIYSETLSEFENH